jgi:hypothetical protein
MDLAEFVKARLDEDEDYVRTMFDVAKRQEAKAAEMSDSELAKLMPAVMGLLAAEPAIPAISAQWAARGTKPPNDLNRVLREVEAKRVILTWWENELRGLRSPGARERASRSLPGFAVIFTLAAVWREHPDYDPDWSPGAEQD